MKTLGDYYDLCLMTDVLVLADTFEIIYATSMKYYKIDPCNLYLSPGTAWNTILKIMVMHVQLLGDFNMHIFVKAVVRGGNSMLPNRYSKVNNLYVSDNEWVKENNNIKYLDCSNPIWYC